MYQRGWFVKGQPGCLSHVTRRQNGARVSQQAEASPAAGRSFIVMPRVAGRERHDVAHGP